MTLEALIARCRGVLSDLTKPFLWLDAEMTIFVNDCIARVIRETRVSTTERRVVFGVNSGTAEYPIPNNVVEVVRVRIASRPLPLAKTTYVELGSYGADLTATASAPTAYVLDLGTRTIRLYPVPSEDNSLTMDVIAMPEEMVFEGSGRVAEIPLISLWQPMLVDGVVALCYQKDTPDTANLQKSVFYETKFNKSIGQMLTEKRWFEDKPYTAGSRVAYY